MQGDQPLKFLFVVNPISGGRSKHNWELAITNFFRPGPHAVEIFLLTGKNDAASLEHWINSFQPHRVIAVGGDGTINLVAQKLMGTEMVMGILPAGSANGFARELGLPPVPEEALRIIEYGRIKKTDVLKLNDEYISLHLADVGLNAQLIKYFEESHLRGMAGYAKVLFKTIWKTQRIKIQIELDEEVLSRQAYMVVLANSKTYGTGAVINPIGELGDGKFEVVIVKKLSLSELIKMIFLRRGYDPKKVEIHRTTKALIRTEKSMYFQSDGEYHGRKKMVTAWVLPAKLNVLIPQG